MEQRLQEQIDSLHKEHGAIRERLLLVEQAVHVIPDMDRKLDALNGTLTKYHGFAGGVAFFFTGLVLFIKGGWAVFTEWLSK